MAGLKEGKDRSLSDPLDPDEEFARGYDKGKEEAKDEQNVAFNEGKIEGAA